MYPALSVILFSSLSGSGYGLLFLLALLAPAGLLPGDSLFPMISLALALGLVTVGLSVSALHLHHPERAWRAFSQWRSSWLSREGVAAVATYIPALALAWLWLFSPTNEAALTLAGASAALLAVLTVYCTANIYASLKTVRQWHQRSVTPVFLGMALESGALSLLAVVSFFARPPAPVLAAAAALVVAVWGLKWLYWRAIDRGVSASTAASATGLKGSVSALDPPHTEDNYLLTEMGYRVARKHAFKLRRIALLLGLVLPGVLLALATLAPNAAVAGLLSCAAVLGLLGIIVERWLFFAEATHTVTLYYGR